MGKPMESTAFPAQRDFSLPNLIRTGDLRKYDRGTSPLKDINRSSLCIKVQLQSSALPTELCREKLHYMGIEPMALAWKASMLPLH